MFSSLLCFCLSSLSAAAAAAAGRPITLKVLLSSGCLSHIKHGVKLLANGKERWTAQGVRLEVTAASAAAIHAIERTQGSVVSTYLSRLALHAHLHPERYDIPIRAPRPPPGKIAYYTDYRNRGYLSSRLQLQALKARLAEGTAEQPTMLMPIFAGGAAPDKERVILDIDVHAGKKALQ